MTLHSTRNQDLVEPARFSHSVAQIWPYQSFMVTPEAIASCSTNGITPGQGHRGDVEKYTIGHSAIPTDPNLLLF